MNFHPIIFASLSLVLAGCGQTPQDSQESAPAAAVPAPPAEPELPTDAPAQAAVDPVVHGKSLFTRCMACHSADAGKNGVGPSLNAVVGRASASVPGFAYSPAMQAANLTWDDATLAAYLENPQGLVKGNKMAFVGLKNPQDREDMIAYLKTLR